MDATSLIIVNYHTESHLLATLSDLASRPGELPGQVIVVDNSPQNGLREVLSGLDMVVAYQATDRNLGFAGGVNLGLEQSRGRFIILLNPDARPQAGCLPGLIRVLADQPDIGVAGPAMLSCGARPQAMISATRRDPTLATFLAEYTVLHRLLPRDWLQHHYFVPPGQGRDPVDCAMVQGACFAMRRDWLERTGPFDAKRFFLYWEETDFCRRLRALGGRVVYCPQLSCLHEGGVSTGGDQDISLFWQSLHAWHRKHHGTGANLFLRALLVPGIGAELLILALLMLRPRRAPDPRHLVRLRRQLRQQFRCGSRPS